MPNFPSDTYLNFFLDTMSERHVFLQGGRRSGKTFATFQALYYLCSSEPTTIMVICFTYDQLKHTIKDFEDALGSIVYGTKKDPFVAQTPNITWTFNHFDTPQKAQGTKCDVLFINEAVNVSEEVANTLYMGVRRQIVYNYNPTGQFYASHYFKPTDEPTTKRPFKNVLCTTWEDNEFLTEQQKDEFREIKRKAELPTATPFDVFNYQVYYLGNFSNLSGSVFGQVYTCQDEDYRECPTYESYGMDFGFAKFGDPTTLIGVKVYDQRVYVHEYVYLRGLDLQGTYDAIIGSGLTDNDVIAGDYGGQGRERMDDLINAGLSFCNAVKTTIKGGLERLNNYQIYVTESSINTRKEMAGYEYDNGIIKARNGDHAIDALRYAFSDWCVRWDGLHYE